MKSVAPIIIALLIAAAVPAAAQRMPGYYDVRSYGARGDGKTLDTTAINKAIETASTKGGGTVYFGPGTYLSFSIRLKSNITLHLDTGATLLAADPAVHKGSRPRAERPAALVAAQQGSAIVPPRHVQDLLVVGARR
jgi:polygalacturonase